MSCGNRNALNADKVERFKSITLNLKTKLDGFADALHQFIEGFRLSVAAS